MNCRIISGNYPRPEQNPERIDRSEYHININTILRLKVYLMNEDDLMQNEDNDAAWLTPGKGADEVMRRSDRSAFNILVGEQYEAD